MNINSHSKIICFFQLSALLFIVLIFTKQSIAKEEKKSQKAVPKLPANYLWCGTSDNNTYLDFCFPSEKECKNFSLKRRETNGGKLTMCRPTKIK
tara:strand:- start:50 stop:334 length:285 start_codon:yes stop_codon:yes gene_type:complete